MAPSASNGCRPRGTGGERRGDERGHARHRQGEHQRAAEREPGEHLPPRVADLIVGRAQERHQEEHQDVAGDDAHHESRLRQAAVQGAHQFAGPDPAVLEVARVAVKRAPHAARHHAERACAEHGAAAR